MLLEGRPPEPQGVARCAALSALFCEAVGQLNATCNVDTAREGTSGRN